MIKIVIDDIVSDDEIKVKLSKSLSLTWNKSSKEIVHFNKDEEEETILAEHDSNIVLVKKLNNQYFISISDDNSIKIWKYSGKLYSSFDNHNADIIGLEIYDDSILSISKNDSIRFSNFKGKELFVINSEIDSLEKITVWKNDSIHILNENKLSIYDIKDGNQLISFENQLTFINGFKRLTNDSVLTKSDDLISLWNHDGTLIKKFDIHFKFKFTNLIEINNTKIAILMDKNAIYIIDYNGEILSSYLQEDEFIANFKKFIQSSVNLDNLKNTKTNINQFPHYYNSYFNDISNSVDEIKKQELDFDNENNNKTIWDFFNRPQYTPIKTLLKKEENLTKRFKKSLVVLKNTKEEVLKTSEEILEKIIKSKSTMIMLFFISVIAGGGVGYFVDQTGYGILVFSILFISLVVSKNSEITTTQNNIEKLKKQLDTIDTISIDTHSLIKGINTYRRTLFDQFPVIQDNTLYNGEKVNAIIDDLLNNSIKVIAMKECGLKEDDIVGDEAIILNDWSLLQSNTKKVNTYNINSFWGVKNKIIFATQFIQYIFLSKDKIDVFSTHYDFVKNECIRKESNAFYYKDVTNITKKEVDRVLMTSNKSLPATEITLKVSSGDYLEFTIFNRETFEKLNAEINNAKENDDSDDTKLSDLEKERKEIENDNSYDEDEKQDELSYIDKQITSLNSKVSISDTEYEETNKADATIKNIRKHVQDHKQ